MAKYDPLFTNESTPSSSPQSPTRRRRRKRWRRRRNQRHVSTQQKVRDHFDRTRHFLRVWGPWLVVATLALVAWGMYAQMKQSPYFALQQVNIPLHLPWKKQEVMKAAGIKLGDNLFALSLGKITAKLQKDPRVQWVRIHRELPNKLHMDMKINRPVALVQLESLYLMDREGKPFAKISEKQAPKDLLRITGFRRSNYQQAPKAMQLLFRQALALRQLYQRLNLQRYQTLREIQYDPILGYTLHTETSRIYLGKDKFLQRMKRLQTLCQMLWRQGVRKLQYVYLNNTKHPRRVIVRPLDSVAEVDDTDPMSPNKKKKPTSTGRKENRP